MGLLIVLLILTVGYKASRHVTEIELEAKESSGWQTYVIYSYHGMFYIAQAIFVLIALCLIPFCFLYIFESLINFFCGSVSLTGWLKELINWFSESFKGNIILIFIIFGTALAMIDDKKKGLRLNSESFQLHSMYTYMISKSFKEGIPLKISLASGKVYIGRVWQEKLDNTYITILPIYSGYRDKTTQKMVLTTDYLKFYDANANANANAIGSNHFCAINLKEVESISFYYLDVIEEFSIEEKEPS